MNKFVELGIKGAVISSSMIMTTEVLGVYDAVYKRGNKIATLIAGNSLGFVIGRKVATSLVNNINDAIAAYNNEGESDG